MRRAASGARIHRLSFKIVARGPHFTENQGL
jgi:hypothetical protein